MILQAAPVVDDRFLATGDAAGTVPGDRHFRPDVEGLRAIAVSLVVLYHAGIPALGGGFVGVDVFFVISGFVITGLLFRERAATSRTSILNFYARRCRRILPAATLVLLVTILATYLLLGVVSGNRTADDGRWVAVFLSNFHFTWVGTNYFSASLPPSPLQNYWSLSVEEQFYVVFPTVFLLVASAKIHLSLRVRMAITLCLIIVASYWLSIVQTPSNQTAAFFSPLHRAWELALGALVAVTTPWLRRIPSRFAAVVTWTGVGAVLCSAFALNARTVYPGWRVALPVAGAALIIAGGAAIPRFGAESLLGTYPFQKLGRLSYSLYLWHWPILVIAAQYFGKASLPVDVNILLIIVALVASAATYRLIENPIRHSRISSRRSIGIGVGLITTTVLILALVSAAGAASPSQGRGIPGANLSVVLREVAAAPDITVVPEAVSRADYGTAYTEGNSMEGPQCIANFTQTSQRICNIGDPTGSYLVVLYGDSHAVMWIPAFEAIARTEHWRLVVLAKYGCPAARVAIYGTPAFGEPLGRDTPCDEWHSWATAWINRHRPGLLVVSEMNSYDAATSPEATPTRFTRAQWQGGLQDLFESLTVPNMKTVFLGSTPVLPHGGPDCLAAHATDVQKCSLPIQLAVSPLNQVDRKIASDYGVEYVDTVPWFCSRTCTSIIGDYDVYDATGAHVSGPWAQYLQNVLSQKLLDAPLRT